MRLKITQKNATGYYSAIHALYFCVSALITCYASAFLLDYGFTNTQIGIAMGIAYLASALLQPLLATFAQKTGIRLGNCLCVLSGIIALLAVMMWLVPTHGLALLVMEIVVLMLHSAMQSAINALYRGYHNRGTKINFSLARGMGSVAFSLTNLLAGLLLRSLSITTLPALYLIPSILLSLVLVFFHAPNVASEEHNSVVTPKEKRLLLRQYPYFYLFLAGVMFLGLTHTFTESYLFQIMENIGGTSSNLGIAMAITAITELPAMLLYKRIYKRFGNRKLLGLACWIWALKSFCITIAPNVYVIYAAELLQFAGYAIYVPAGVRYVAHAIPESEYMKGQALVGSSFTVGQLLAVLVGGRLIDKIGVRPSLWCVQVCSVIGVTLFTLAMRSSLKRFPSIKEQ